MKRKWKIRLVRNPEYRPDYYPSEGEGPSADYPGDSALGLLADAGKRVPFIDEIDYRYVDEQYTSWMMFLSKQADAAGIPRETFESVVRPDKQLTDSWKKRHIALARYTDPPIYWIVFNMEDPVLGRCKALRQAICLGYDVESEIKVLMNGRGKRATNIVPTDFKGHAEAGPGPYARYDLAAARQRSPEAKASSPPWGCFRGRNSGAQDRPRRRPRCDQRGRVHAAAVFRRWGCASKRFSTTGPRCSAR